jgi:hypothetical protein
MEILVIHVEALKRLAPEEFMEINEEHLRLKNTLINLSATCHNLNNQLDCQSCDREQVATCQGRLISFFYNIINFSTTHFKHEESIMLRQPGITRNDAHFLLHQQAHIDLLNALDKIISDSDALYAKGKTAEAYRQLFRKISEQFEEHDRAFDSIYVREMNN